MKKLLLICLLFLFSCGGRAVYLCNESFLNGKAVVTWDPIQVENDTLTYQISYQMICPGQGCRCIGFYITNEFRNHRFKGDTIFLKDGELVSDSL